MALSKLLARPKGKPTAVAWAIACDLRRAITGARFSRWPQESLTAKEERHLQRAMGYLAAAEEEICRLQSSLSKRSKEAGFDSPDYKTARTLS